MYYLNLVVLVLACLGTGLAEQATNTLNCHGVPYRTIKELREDSLLQPYRADRNSTDFDSYRFMDDVQSYICNTVGRPLIWATMVNSYVEFINIAVQDAIKKYNHMEYESPKMVSWIGFEWLLKQDKLKDWILDGFEDNFSKVNLEKDEYLVDRDRVVGNVCRHLKDNFQHFFTVFRTMGNYARNDQFVYHLADYDKNLRLAIIAHRTCEKINL